MKVTFDLCRSLQEYIKDQWPDITTSIEFIPRKSRKGLRGLEAIIVPGGYETVLVSRGVFQTQVHVSIHFFAERLGNRSNDEKLLERVAEMERGLRRFDVEDYQWLRHELTQEAFFSPTVSEEGRAWLCTLRMTYVKFDV